MAQDSSIQCPCRSMMLSIQLQMVREPGSPTLMHLRGDATAAQHAAGAGSLVLQPLVVLARLENRLATGQGDPHGLPPTASG